MKPAQIVILVDESGSIGADDMVREQNAARLIAQGEFSTRSTVSVVGFASDNGTRSPVDAVCPQVVVTGPAEREHLAECVGGLRKRSDGEGNGTDHAQALAAALGYLGQGSPDDGPKLVFLLTDGVLDVTGSQQYGTGKTTAQITAAAQEVIRTSLATARQRGVQVWPLGFGKVDEAALRAFAEGGYQGSCGPTVPKPSAKIVAGSADVGRAMLESYANARCAGQGPIVVQPLSPGSTVETQVSIPAIATDGAITVVKQDGRVRVDYLDPTGAPVPKTGSLPSGRFEVSGENGGVEVLRITDPTPGTWTVRATSPPEVPQQEVLTTVTWLGAAQATILVDPRAPAKGQPVTVSVQALLRGGKPIAQPDLLRGLSFTAEASGKSLPAQEIPLRDDGQDPDAAPDGTYTGRMTLPDDVTGVMTFRGRVTGLGISAADAVATVEVSPELPKLLATATLPRLGEAVAPGRSQDATVSVSNNTGQRKRLRVEVNAAGGAQVTIPAADAVHDVDPGQSTFTVPLVIGANTPEGYLTGVVRIVNDANPSTVVHEKPFTIQVAYPPPPFPWLTTILVTLLGIAGITAALWLVLRRRSQEVRGLRVHVVRGEHRVYLPTEERQAKEFRFTVDGHGPVPRLDLATAGDPAAYVLTRSRAGLRLRTPFGETVSTQLDEPVEVGEGLSVVVTMDPDYAPAEPPPDDPYAGYDRPDQFDTPPAGEPTAHFPNQRDHGSWDEAAGPPPPRPRRSDPYL
ncbi:VWA domain-containing protein [Actinokineospora enzanensis]|uniref:VWA domain-containing protein n=1 Tax=Actinokineospora enzanensis TaxID=155975 RepID=UPI000374B056|nr:VWA domain-containing protein [Actinokineospora enzanensis]